MEGIKNPKKYVENIGRMVTKTVHAYDLIQPGDKILVAISGGKDSYVLLDSLVKRKKHMPMRYDLAALHVEVNNMPYAIDKAYLEQYCRKWEVPLSWHTMTLDLDTDPSKSPCFICSWHRRKALFNAVQGMGFHKLAMGHHMDDAIETLFMNMIHKGSISSIPPKLTMFDNKFEIIRPLIGLSKEQINNYAAIEQFPVERKNCPYDDQTMRFRTKEFMNYLESLNEHARKNIYRSMSKIFVHYLPYTGKNAEESIKYDKK